MRSIKIIAALIVFLTCTPAFAQIFVTTADGISRYDTNGNPTWTVADADSPQALSMNGPDSLMVLNGGVFDANGYVAGSGSVASYTLDGAPINLSLAVGLDAPTGMTFPVDASTLFTNTPDNVTIISPIVLDNFPIGPSISGENLYVSAAMPDGLGFVGNFQQIAGGIGNPTLAEDSDFSEGSALSGHDFYLCNSSGDSIGEYTLDGDVVNESLITGLPYPVDMIISHGVLYVLSRGDGYLNSGTVGEYTLDGEPINADLISGINEPTGLAVVPFGNPVFIPEPGTLLILGLGLVLFVLFKPEKS